MKRLPSLWSSISSRDWLRAIPSGIHIAQISPKRWTKRAFGEVHRSAWKILLETKTCYWGLTLVAYPHSFLLVYLPLCLQIPWSPGNICAIYSGGFRPSKERSQSLLTTWGNASRNRQRKPRSSLLDSDSWRCNVRSLFPLKIKQVSICLKGLRYEFGIPLAPVGITTFAQLIERASELMDIIKEKEVKAISFPRMAQTKSWQTFQKSLYHSRWRIRTKNIKSKRSTYNLYLVHTEKLFEVLMSFGALELPDSD